MKSTPMWYHCMAAVGNPSSLEYIRQFKTDICSIHVTLVPYLKAAQNCKQSRHSSVGTALHRYQPDIIVCRCEEALSRN